MSLFFFLEHKRGKPYTKNRITKPEIKGVYSLIDRKIEKIKRDFLELERGNLELERGNLELERGKAYPEILFMKPKNKGLFSLIDILRDILISQGSCILKTAPCL